MDYLIHIMIMTGIYVILALSLNLIMGYTGIPAFGHAAFSCAGAYCSALFVIQVGVSTWMALLIGGMAAMILGTAIGMSSFRLKDDYIALTTFGTAIIVYTIANNWVSVTKGPNGLAGIPGFSMLGYEFSTNWSYLILVLFFVILTIFLINRIVNSPYGRILKGIREDEIAVSAMGKNINLYKNSVFMIGAFFAGIAGSLYAHYITFIDPSSFTIMESITILLMVVFGGMGSIRGSIVGAIVLVILPEILRFIGLPSSIAAPLRQMIYGLLLIILMIKRPQGLMGVYKFR